MKLIMTLISWVATLASIWATYGIVLNSDGLIVIPILLSGAVISFATFVFGIIALNYEPA